MNDHELAIAAKAGDQKAFTSLMQKHYPALCRHVTFIVKDNDIAEDIVQDGLIKAFYKLKTYKTDQKFSAWLYKIVHNQSLDYLRKKRDISLEILPELPDENQDTDFELDDRIDRSEQIRRLRKAMAKLPIREQAIINLFYWEDMKYEDIAVVMSVPVGTVKTWLFRAKRSLKEFYDEEV